MKKVVSTALILVIGLMLAAFDGDGGCDGPPASDQQQQAWSEKRFSLAKMKEATDGTQQRTAGE